MMTQRVIKALAALLLAGAGIATAASTAAAEDPGWGVPAVTTTPTVTPAPIANDPGWG